VKRKAFRLIGFLTLLGYLQYCGLTSIARVEASDRIIVETSSATPTPRNGLNKTKPTQAIHLPIVQQNPEKSQAEHPADNDSPDEITATPTITPTPIPPQSPSENMPSVFGATAIVLIILFTWLISITRKKVSTPPK
jgi:hypothetical protein